MKKLGFCIIVIAIIFLGQNAFAQTRHIVDGYFDVNGNPVPFFPSPIVSSGNIIYCTPGYQTYLSPPVIYYWHPGHWYRSELTGYQWRWRNGHWCTNPNPH